MSTAPNLFDQSRVASRESRSDFMTPSRLQLMLDSGRSVPAGAQLGEHELAVLGCLKDAFGQGAAVSLKDICARTELPERAVKGVVESLIGVHGLKVGSSRGHKRKWAEGRYEVVQGGYYWCQTDDEILHSIGPVYAQALSELRRVWAMVGGSPGLKHKLLEHYGQLPLDIAPLDSARGDSRSES